MSKGEKESNIIDDELVDSVHYGYKKDLRTALPQFIAVSVKNLLLLSYGMTLGFQTILIPAVKDPKDGEILHLDQSEISWISSLNLIVVPIGCALSGIVSTPIGRRRAMQVVNVPFFIAWLLFHFSTTTEHLYGALVLNGLAGGLLEAPVLTYVAEITQPHLRGALSATSSMCIIIGIFTQFLFGLFLYWRTVALVNIISTVIAVIALCFVPESPHWLVSKQRDDDARKSLQWLRGWIGAHRVEEELKDIRELFSTKNEADGDDETWTKRISLYTDKSFIKPLFLVCFAFFVGHFSGMTTLQVYAVSIFEMLDAPLDKYYATLVLGILQILGSTICVFLVHYTGKRPLTLFSTAGAGVCCMLVAFYHGLYVLPMTKLHSNLNLTAPHSSLMNESDTNISLAKNFDAVTPNPYAWVPMTLLMMLALITHTGIRLLPWVLIGEVFSAKTRSGAAGLSSAIGYILNFLTNKFYLSLVGTLSIWGTYGLYGIISIMGCLLFYFILPETEGKKLNEIQNHFSGVGKLSNEVYRSKRRIEHSKVSKVKVLKGVINQSFEASTDL